VTRDERREFVLNSGLFDGDTTDLDGAVNTYFTRTNFDAMFGSDWAEIHDEADERVPATEADWSEVRAEARGMIADRGER
jgi:hypothetical protein|tara:strand:- start:540 stop:779 length:240 start_codon:yes stop_codon:yes gene_type:complete